MNDDPLSFVHLSDLHFRQEDIGSQFDTDADIRNELRRDLRDIVEQTGAIRGILISGDIAFAGKRQEYDVASQWLDELCGFLECNQTDVWTVPGNHDVDHHQISRVSKLLHKEIRNQEGEDINRELRNIIEEDESAEILLKPLSSYQDFAGRYECFTTSDQLAWTDQLTLNDGSTLCLWGCNSALISGPTDHKRHSPMVLGNPQYTLPNREGIAYLVLCHHPCTWMLDQTEAERMFNQRASIQLYGHEHWQHTEKVDESLRLFSGALHPNRNEGRYEPRYNVLSIRVSGEHDDRQLEVNVRSRVYRDGTFMEAPGTADTYRLRLLPWHAPASPQQAAATAPVPADEPVRPNVSPIRHLTYLFYNLPFTKRLEVALKLGLIEDEDYNLPESDLFPLLLRRAIDEDKVDAMLEAINEARA